MPRNTGTGTRFAKPTEWQWRRAKNPRDKLLVRDPWPTRAKSKINKTLCRVFGHGKLTKKFKGELLCTRCWTVTGYWR